MKIQQLYLDILNQSHTLIAGCTGSGKSVVLNNILQAHCAALSAPFVLLDPKRVELLPWARDLRCIGHAVTPDAITEELRRMCALMDRRYQDMERRGLRKTDQPHIYVYIDELADLMSGGGDFLFYLLRLLRVGRAAGLHVIAATQDPSRKTIPAALSQNFTRLLGLRCRSAIESRQIIGAPGCEALPLHGEALYLSPDLLRPSRVQIDCQADTALFAAILPKSA